MINLSVPPLRVRKEDIPLLAQDFLTVFAEKNQKQIKVLTPQAMDRLLKYQWPGNVRELMNTIERAIILLRSEYLDEQDIQLVTEGELPRSDEVPTGYENSSNLPLYEVEKATILNMLESTGGNKSEAARRLGITRKTLHKKLKKYGMMP